MTNRKRQGIKKHPVLQDKNLSSLSSGSSKSKYSSNFNSEYTVSSDSNFKYHSGKNFDEMEISEHLTDLWIVLRNIAKTVFIATAIILVLPGYANGKLALNPYKPAVLQLLNILIEYSISSLEAGGDVQVFIGSPLTPITFTYRKGMGNLEKAFQDCDTPLFIRCDDIIFCYNAGDSKSSSLIWGCSR
jgi:hypothetical protein